MNWTRVERIASPDLTAPGLSPSCLGVRAQVKEDAIYCVTYNAYVQDPHGIYVPAPGDFMAITVSGPSDQFAEDRSEGPFPGVSIGTHFRMAVDETLFTTIDRTPGIPWRADLALHWVAPWVPVVGS